MCLFDDYLCKRKVVFDVLRLNVQRKNTQPISINNNKNSVEFNFTSQLRAEKFLQYLVEVLDYEYQIEVNDVYRNGTRVILIW